MSQPNRWHRARSLIWNSQLLQTILRTIWQWLGGKLLPAAAALGVAVTGIVWAATRALRTGQPWMAGALWGFWFCLFVVLVSLAIHVFQRRREVRSSAIRAPQSSSPMVLLKCIKTSAGGLHRYNAGDRFGVPPHEVADHLRTGAFVEIDREAAFADLVMSLTEVRRLVGQFGKRPPDHGSYYPHGSEWRNEWIGALGELRTVIGFAEKFDGDAANYGELRSFSEKLREETDGHGRLDVYKTLSKELGDWLAKRLDRRGRGLT